MKCPVDQVELHMSERQGIEVDYCPQCRGVWLDRGELDKIIDRSGAPSSSSTGQTSSRRDVHEYDRPPKHDSYDSHHQGYKKRKKENFLGDLFDF